MPSVRPGTRLPAQIRDTIRRSVLAGQLRPGSQLPSSRALASELGVSRNSVVDAYDQLLVEGYLESRRGSGTFVAPHVAARASRWPTVDRPAASRTSVFGLALAEITTSHSSDALRPFSPGIPALEPSLLRRWIQTSGRVRRRITPELLNYGDAAGYGPLREAIASRLGPTRGVTCGPDQVVITSGTQQGLAIAAQLLCNPGDTAWIEDPGYPGAAAAFAAAGARLAHVPVDSEGIRVASGVRRAPSARLAYVSPSHQYPLGVTTTLPRRLELLQWAEENDAWILEDDYDSEFRYDGRSLPALQGLDRRGRVLYLGTFSKTLFPSLRIGYVIVPPSLGPAFAKAVSVAGHGPPLIEQAVLHRFIETGSYTRHLRQMRRIYAERNAAFCEGIHRRLGRVLRFHGEAMGLHVACELLSEEDDRRISERAAAAGLSLPALSSYFGGPRPKRGFVMGYGHLTTLQIRSGIAALSELLRTIARS
ncbi:MAG TPA: PLP-dependent aminotransferase family protein [Thermoanaerobaculia bacterium]|nr:PLP-dependent aminotransferase family protein [Thermoanaerobaculia bacterium]